ncbi:MAG: hypothetical protein G01um10147_168 [Microgenomates group bacterium Gr01-1014_7]|nr:MAG: hypothetical protein G01um10147_168 [Microgenomates group bacterium Gr01-1014_7]
MQSKKIIIVCIIFLAVILVLVFSGRQSNLMVTPTSSPGPTPTVMPKPKTFQFDSSTDLNAELEKVDPKVLESDFE